MSAKINSSKTKTDAYNSVEEAATGVGELMLGKDTQCLETNEVDASDFLLSNSKYHDCFITVGNPKSEKVEKIGVTSVYLVANSHVFRNMFLDYKQEDLSSGKIVVTDVSPATFKHMLRYLYGGELPRMTAVETAGLALCADKYKIRRLVKNTLIILKPTSAEDVFPALICVTYASFPELEVQVCKLIQQDTDKVVENADFLKLDENCVLFILKQDRLNVGEVELWKHVVRWAEHQVEADPARTVRDCLARILGYARFLTFTLEEVVEHVLPTKILTPEEFMDLMLAVTKKQNLTSSSLCNVLEKRGVYQEEEAKDTQSVTENKPEFEVTNNLCVLRISDHLKVKYEHLEYSSELIITSNKRVKIMFFTFIRNTFLDTCEIETFIDGKSFNYEYGEEFCEEERHFNRRERILHICSQPVMNPNERWTFKFHWFDGNPAITLCPNDTWGEICDLPVKDENLTVIFEDHIHVLAIGYKILQ